MRLMDSSTRYLMRRDPDGESRDRVSQWLWPHPETGRGGGRGVTTVSGARVEVVAINAEGDLPDGGWEKLAAADCLIFGAPTYMGSVSWPFKKFADASSKPWFAQLWKDKLAAGFTNSASMNGDKLSTLHYLFTLAMQHSMIWAGTGMLPANSKAAQRNDLNYLGSFAGLMAQSPRIPRPMKGRFRAI